MAHPAPPPDASLSVFDRADALSRIAEDEALLDTLLEMFIANAPDYLGEIDAALSPPDWPRLARAAHTLKSILATFSAGRGEAAAQALERAARSEDAVASRDSAKLTRAEVATFLQAL